ncbi:hypothetical protein MBM09_01155 [Flaviramulus sp. BrNp1-15]|uniref:hypothetical protein n=1 Tax=Flaviramulus sp. BrNp1-15 TaxID=2916754 RepID=UPI001EE87858|nr:hypothetical protein [Flaviramulus sp. BrNp1-15]ULC59598.1 hypothetical protein MBM09_01155 [Flaviramulus sp. BrNp1-15]
MAKNITYLLGAGASYNALPIVKDIPNALNDFSEEFNPSILNNSHPNSSIIYKDNIINNYLSQHEELKNNSEYILKFHNDIVWLKKESEKHTSIDTFAKKLHLKEDYENLKRLKIILSCFFLYLQTKKFDNRYDSFFASILDNLSELPGNLKILSWNYDSQLEIAFNRFSNSTIENTRKVLNVFSKGQKTNLNPAKPNEFCVFKVNGTTNATNNKNEIYDILLDFDSKELSLAEDLLELYSTKANYKLYNPNMSFAWENFNQELQFYSNLRESIEKTDILIVIGYSLPFFNRKIDRFILDSMDNLKKIYVQDPKYAEGIIEKIKELIPSHNIKFQNRDKIEFKPLSFTDQFFIPIEF